MRGTAARRPTNPRQSASHSPRMGPNMLRPMTTAPRVRIRSSRAATSPSWPGLSVRNATVELRSADAERVLAALSGPATKPSTEIDM